MKKCLLVFAILILLPIVALGESYFGEDFVPEGGVQYARMQPTVGGEFVYVCYEDGAVYRWRMGEASPETLCVLPGNPAVLENGETPYADMTADARALVDETAQLLVADDTALYAVNLFAGRVGTVDERGISWLPARFDTSLVQDNGFLRVTPYALIAGRALYILTLYDEEGGEIWWNCSVVAVDIDTGEATRHKTRGAQEMCPYKDGKLLLLCQDENERRFLSALDPATGEMAELSLALPGAGAGLAYDASLDAIYFADDGAVYASKAGAAFERLYPLPYGYIYEGVQGFALQGGRYGLRLDGVGVFEPWETPDEMLTLSLHWRDDGAAQAFLDAHPGAVLDARYSPMTCAQVANLLRAGDASIDVFEVYVDNTFGAFKQKGYAAPLDETLFSEAEALYPAVRAALTDASGRLVAFPSQLNVSLWSANAAIWREYFGNEPLPTTWAELLSAYLRFEDGQGPDDGALFLEEWSYENLLYRLITAFVEQRSESGAPPDFSAPELREALSLLAEVNESFLSRGIDYLFEGDVYPESEVLDKSIFYTGGGGNAILTTSDDLGGAVDIPPFVFTAGDAPVIHGYMRALVVNPLSDNQALAREYIACAASRESDIVRYYALRPGENEPIEREDYAARLADYQRQQAALEETLANPDLDPEEAAIARDSLERVQWYLERPGFLRWRISPEGIARWRAIAPSIRFFEDAVCVPSDGDAADTQLRALCAQYAGGQADMDGFLMKLTDTMRLIWQEK